MDRRNPYLWIPITFSRFLGGRWEQSSNHLKPFHLRMRATCRRMRTRSRAWNWGWLDACYLLCRSGNIKQKGLNCRFRADILIFEQIRKIWTFRSVSLPLPCNFSSRLILPIRSRNKHKSSLSIAIKSIEASQKVSFKQWLWKKGFLLVVRIRWKSTELGRVLPSQETNRSNSMTAWSNFHIWWSEDLPSSGWGPNFSSQWQGSGNFELPFQSSTALWINIPFRNCHLNLQYSVSSRLNWWLQYRIPKANFLIHLTGGNVFICF